MIGVAPKHPPMPRSITDARNDVIRLEPFFAVGRRVADMDRKRAKSLAFVSNFRMAERDQALQPQQENARDRDRLGVPFLARPRRRLSLCAGAASHRGPVVGGARQRARVLLETRSNDACGHWRTVLVSKGWLRHDRGGRLELRAIVCGALFTLQHAGA